MVNKIYSLSDLFLGRIDKTNYFAAVIINIPISFLSQNKDFINSHTFIYLAILIPTLVVVVGASIRRLHDLNRTGWYSLFLFVPILGFLMTVMLW